MHAGHRERMKRRFRETGLNGFDDVNVLELLSLVGTDIYEKLVKGNCDSI